ncbi:peptidase family M48-domain-containing protein [Massariosphaeria phaeospora]|uniref:Peptidase family M48-domain-containing protein n=1 Tax=Massariosphaeria phaeospora TaxID=100035 RepID=A0A7C8LZL1_9PLEO|nr:peptidase family M48-domain-containing protein [Massariosphaeria phaeospora]
MFRYSTRLRTPFQTRTQTRAYRQVRFGDARQQYRRFDTASNLFARWAARPTFYRDVGLISAGSGGFYLYNLETVPVSGRRRFNIISPSFEEYVGQSTVEQIKETYKGQLLPDRDPRVKKIKQILERLLPYAQSAGLEDVNWEVFVIDSPEQNAFVVPGGKVFVFTGILPLCRDDDGIAAVLGHEIAHVVGHHAAERMSQAPLVLLGILLLWTVDISFYSSKMLVELFLSRPGSRKQEAEADYIGLLMMAQGCYRPEAAMEFWTRMEKLGQQGPPQILSTHPSHHSREEKIREWLPQAKEKAEMSDCHATAVHGESAITRSEQ